MPHDELLEQIRQPLWERVDRRLVGVLSVSIAVHVGIAIAAWLGDPPDDRAWLRGDDPQVIYSHELPDEPLVVPAPPVGPGPGPGVAAPIAPQTQPVAPVRLRRPAAARPIDPSALISDLLGDGPSFRDVARRQVGRDLADQIADANQRRARARIGTDGVEETPGIDSTADTIVDDPDGPRRTVKRPESPPPRTVWESPPLDVPYDPSGDIRVAWMRALQRCYQAELAHDPSLRGRVDLEFTIGTTGLVTAARGAGLGAVASCVADLARGWRFPVELPVAAQFRVALIFVPD